MHWDQSCSSTDCCVVLQNVLRNRLQKEGVRNTIDSRSRLDKDGKRYGKMVKFEVSELRAIELLDDLCQEMKHYHLTEDETSWVWQKNKQETAASKHHQRYLMNVCSDIIGQWEDDLSRAIRSGKANAESDIVSLLCRDMTQLCGTSTAQNEL
jgi:hypothetical protein